MCVYVCIYAHVFMCALFKLNMKEYFLNPFQASLVLFVPPPSQQKPAPHFSHFISLVNRFRFIFSILFASWQNGI